MGELNEFTSHDSIPMVQCTSDMIAAFGYAEEEFILQIEFKNGDTWQYFDVPESIYTELSSSESVGKFFHEFIKNEYRGSRV